MEDECEVKHYHKVFGNCVVYWKIEDFCLATCEDNYKIQSSEFSVRGPVSTRWKLTLIPKPSSTCCMQLHLERLIDSGPITVHVNWSLTIGTLNEDCYYSEYNHQFEKLTRKRTDVYNLSDLLSIFPPFGSDTLIICCHLIVQHRDKTARLYKPNNSGLGWLSEDLGLMYRSDKDKDIILKVGKREILAHKAILSRNAVLEQFIHNTTTNTVEFPDLNFTAVTKYIDFLYTGDLDKILQNFSIPMYKCLDVMDKDLLKCYFVLEELKLHTKIKVEEFEHLWMISNFSSRKEECIISPLLMKPKLDTAWQLRLDLNGIDNIHYLSVYVDIIKGKRPINLCLEFAVEDSEGETYYPSRILSSNGNYDLGIKEFVKKVYLSNTSLVVDDTLNMVFKVRVWNSDHYSTIGSRIISFTTAIEESPYEHLSKSMLNIFGIGIYSDIFVQTESTTFNAHKCVLSARSPVLARMIKEQKDKIFLTLRAITPCVLKLLLEYIYSGVLHELEHQTLVMLCKAAETYCISSLEDECQEALQKSVEKNPFRLSEESEIKDTELLCMPENLFGKNI